MKKRLAIIIFLSLFLLNGCAIIGKQRKRKPAKGELPITQKFDLDANGTKEVIKVEEDKLGAGPAFILTVTRPDRNKAYTLRLAGRFIKIDLIGMNLEEVDNKQIALSYRDEEDAENLVIYKLGNDRLTKVISMNSPCGIDTDFQTALLRIKVDKPICENDVCACGTEPNWETWIWTGTKFIKDLR